MKLPLCEMNWASFPLRETTTDTAAVATVMRLSGLAQDMTYLLTAISRRAAPRQRRWLWIWSSRSFVSSFRLSVRFGWLAGGQVDRFLERRRKEVYE